jgi:hypothetical protein
MNEGEALSGQSGGGAWSFRRSCRNLAKALLSEPGQSFLIFVMAATYYALMISTRFTYGDGPELLVAAHNLGVSHPSGYPLYTMIAHVLTYLPGSDYFCVALVLSAFTTAAAAAILHSLLLRAGVSSHYSAVAVLGWTTHFQVVYQATRVEVYGLHCLFVALALYGVVRFEFDRDLRWVSVAVFGVCLGLANHLTIAFLILPVLLSLTWVAPSMMWSSRAIGTCTAIAALSAMIYLYLPLAALREPEHALLWNDPKTVQRFWFHVTGQEYAIFRDYDKMVPFFQRFFRTLEKAYFPGMLLIGLLGCIEWWVRARKSALCFLLFTLSILGYVSTYRIGDLSTYYPAIYIPLTCVFAMGLTWIAEVRLGPCHHRRRWMHGGVVILCAVGVAWQGYRSWSNAYSERLAEDMSEAVMSDLEEPALVFTSIDAHTFPMWYQTLVRHPQRQVIVVDRVLFHLENKEWYRAYLRRAYPSVKWPSTEVATRSGWETWLIENNADLNLYGLLQNPWRHSGSHTVLRGWHHRIVPGPRPSANRDAGVRHVYTSRLKRFRRKPYFLQAGATYAYADDPGEAVACVVDWWPHSDLDATWTFRGPGGRKVVFENHRVPKNSNLSWEVLKASEQVPGHWTCEVTAPGKPSIVTRFELKAPGSG